MAQSRPARRPGDARGISPVLRPRAWSALLGAIVAAVLASPAYADPPLPNTVPDTGARPTPAGGLPLPGEAGVPGAGGTTTGVTGPSAVPGATNPIEARIAAKQTEVATLGQQLLKLREELAAARAAEPAAAAAQRAAEAARIAAEREAEAVAAEKLKREAELPPGVSDDLHELGALARIQQGRHGPADTDAAVREAARAQAAARAAQQAYDAARARIESLTRQYDDLEAKFKRAEADLAGLEREHAEEKARLEQRREAREQAVGEEIIRNTSVAGKRAHPKALAALQFALKQRGKPYVWAAEGPDAYDCSGLMWAAYRSVGYRSLPRVANDQYYATRRNSVDRSALLPGDLVFFASGPNWQSIHHVGMYVGDGKMVHAPNSNEVVKVSAVWWSRFYAATRIFPAVDAPETRPSPKPKPKPTPGKPNPTPGRPPSPDPTTPPREEPTNPPGEEPTNPPGKEPTPPEEKPTTPPGEEPTNPPGEEPTNPPGEEPTDPPEQEPSTPPGEPGGGDEPDPEPGDPSPTAEPAT